MTEQIIHILEYANKKGIFALKDAHEIYILTEQFKNYVPKPSVSDAIEILKEHLKQDEEYKKGWEANIALAFKDEHEVSAGAFTIAEIADSAAKRFIDNLIA